MKHLRQAQEAGLRETGWVELDDGLWLAPAPVQAVPVDIDLAVRLQTRAPRVVQHQEPAPAAPEGFEFKA